ncbi:MAG: DNA-binding response regulator [Alphaproteobacteria bacterium]|nr:response regulator transcription factor [Alphaproteobacteria bacterium]TAD89306.1 MAG: DNA-binding response regulator [Alphaproteobacteria bacterium]
MRILLVEDEQDLVAQLVRNLSAVGFVVDHAGKIAEAEAAAQGGRHSLIILDRRLPDGDGLEAIPRLRAAQPGVPILVLTALDSVAARVIGLDRGADDYLVKPFAMDELLARIRAALRRPGGGPQPPLRCGALTFDLMERCLRAHGEPVVLARRELALMEALLQRQGRVVVRDTLMDAIYSYDDEVTPNAFDVLVYRLRRRMAELGAGVDILTMRGLGIMIRATDQPCATDD